MRKSILLAASLVALALALSLGLSARNAPVSGNLAPAVPVHTVTVERIDVPRTLDTLGTVESLHSVSIRPQIDGVLVNLWVKEGQDVEQGTLLASIDDRAIKANLDQARARLAQSQAQLRIASIDLERYRSLSRDNGVSRQQLDQQQALRDQLHATVKGDQAAIQAAEVQLSHTQIHSPVSGRVGLRQVDEGNVLRTSDANGLFTVTRISPTTVAFSLPQSTLPLLQQLVQSNEATPVLAFPDTDTESGTPLAQGRLTLIDNRVSSATGTVRAKAEFPNAEQALWPGQLVNVRLQTGIERQVLTVPSRVVQRGIEQAFVYRVEGEKVVSVPVHVRYRNGQLDVLEGVEEGDELVLDGQSRLRPGTVVRVLGDATTPLAQGEDRS